MPKLIVFNHVSLDGYIADAKGDMSWAHGDPNDAEWNAFVAGNASGDAMLVMGRVTYDLMVKYWPTPLALQQNRTVAEHMNRLPKLVFSKTLDHASWSNTTLVKGDIAGHIRRLKQGSGPGMAILGSGSIVAQLAGEGLIDEYQVVMKPVALGGGKTMFAGLRDKLALKLVKTRSFTNGNVLLCYQPRS